ncbi:Probable LRR receptor-like serine/threonine-protein kinase At4g31250 [Linum perenne]
MNITAVSTIFLIIFISSSFFFPLSHGIDEADALLNFKRSLSNSSISLQTWNITLSPPCNRDDSTWIGLRCLGGSVQKLILDGMGLLGIIDVDSLSNLPNLRTFSVIGNSFDGPFPPLSKLPLKNLYLSGNGFSGQIPDDAFQGMNSLKEIYLANNRFVGPIPGSLLGLKKLTELSLEGNFFSGSIPDLQQPLTVFNVSDNELVGPIPETLAAKFDQTSFSGNKGLCGKPLAACNGTEKRQSKGKIILIIVAVITIVLLITAIMACTFIRGRGSKSTSRAQLNEYNDTKALKKFGPQSTMEVVVGGRGEKGGKLRFVRNDKEATFDLQELLRSSAEVLGSSTFGSSYKAVLSDGPAVVVKRFRHMDNVGKEEFYEHMKRLGTLSHPNLLPLVAFYYRKEEKLLVSDFVLNGSLATHLHEKRRAGEPGLTWPTRLKIIKGVAKGLGFLYQELPDLPLPHGHLKSSNVLLDHTFQPLLTDYALSPVVNREQAQGVMVAYKSPEFIQTERTTKKADVWSLGILILEVLTGKFPANYLRQGKGAAANADLAAWVNSVVREEWTGEVFDKDMKGTKNGEGEMLKLLKIGMCCCEWNVERRWGLTEAVARIEELKEREEDENEECCSSIGSDGDLYSSRAMTENDFSFSVTA